MKEWKRNVLLFVGALVSVFVFMNATIYSFVPGVENLENNIKNEIRFGRIKYVAAIGDSILAGYAAYGTPFIENRRASFFSGTNEYTVASQFALYNNVIGASSGSHFIQVW